MPSTCCNLIFSYNIIHRQAEAYKVPAETQNISEVTGGDAVQEKRGKFALSNCTPSIFIEGDNSDSHELQL